jgi:5-dehydro-2-deoxygluconokinase
MQTDAGWHAACEAITRNDAHTRGIVVLGLGESEESLATSFAKAARFDLVKGFAVGRTIFAEAAEAFMAGRLGEAAAVDMMADRYARLCSLWDQARAQKG